MKEQFSLVPHTMQAESGDREQKYGRHEEGYLVVEGGTGYHLRNESAMIVKKKKKNKTKNQK